MSSSGMSGTSTEDATLEGFSPRGRFTCYHGEGDKVPPHDSDTVRDGKEKREYLEQYYVEAMRRLPLDEMPQLEDCVRSGGHCIGLADPVSNIILNAIHRLPWPCPAGIEDAAPAMKKARTTGRGEWEWIECESMVSIYGQIAFMAEYFRYLSEVQARRYMYMASYDLALAIKLVEYERFSPSSSHRPLLPDGGRMEAALTIAATRAGHPAPDDLARAMTARYPSDKLSGVVAKLQGDELLTTADVWAIRELLSGQGSPFSEVELKFLSHPGGLAYDSSDGNWKLKLSSYLGDDFYAEITIQKLPPHSIDQIYMSNLTFDDSTYMEAKLSKCLAETINSGSGNPGSAVDLDAYTCEHIRSLKMCALDAIHGFYIKALAVLPSSVGESPFIRAMLVAGHCYGPLDPVSNIILSTVWYKVHFPWHCEINAQGGILSTHSMSRVESRSLYGLVAILIFINGGSTTISIHKALEYLYFWNFDLTGLFKGKACNSIPFASATKTGKHPQCDAFGSFLMSLSDEKLSRLRSLLLVPRDGRIPHASLVELEGILYRESAIHETEPSPGISMSENATMEIQRKRLDFRDKLIFVRTELNKLLRQYCIQHPWEPSYEVDIICGVHVQSKSYHQEKLYHANFLASRDAAASGDTTSLPRERTLFFAEFWELPSHPGPPRSRFYTDDDPTSVPPSSRFSSSCCPVYDYHLSMGHCSYCGHASSSIVHPPSGRFSGNETVGSIGLYQSLYDLSNGFLDSGVYESIMDSDYIYFDFKRDAELGKTIDDYCTRNAEYRPQPPNCRLKYM